MKKTSLVDAHLFIQNVSIVHIHIVHEYVHIVHVVHIRDFTIIGTSNNITDLRILESLHINKHKPILNSTVSAFPLSIVK